MIWALLACPSPSIVPAFEAARDEALADPGPAPKRWEPDLALHLSGKMIEDVAREAALASGALKQRVEKDVFGAKVVITPDLAARRVAVGTSDACPACLSVDVTIDGPVTWTALGQRGTTDVTVRGAVDVTIDASGGPGVFDVTLTPKDVGELTVSLGRMDARAGAILEQVIADELRRKLIAGLHPVELGEYGSAEAPLRALRVVGATTGGVWVEMLSSSPSPGALAVRDRPLASGFALYADTGSLVDLARAAAFRAPPLTHEVVAEPTSLQVEGGAFSLGLRLWRPVGAGWWRDYGIAGTLGLGTAERRVNLVATDVTELARSEGAELVDPLATLGEGVILDAITDAARATLPARARTNASGVRIESAVTGVSGEAGVLVVTGTVDASPAPPRRSGSR